MQLEAGKASAEIGLALRVIGALDAEVQLIDAAMSAGALDLDALDDDGTTV